jgi:hypothetical protein
LQASGIKRVLCGHKPFGDSPGVIRATLGFELVCADTSFSDSSATDNRGVAVSEVLIRGGPSTNQVQVHGTLADGMQIHYTLPPLGSAAADEGCDDDPGPSTSAPVWELDAGDELVGRPLRHQWWVKCPVPPSVIGDDGSGRTLLGSPAADEYLIVKGEGFQLEVQRLSAAEVVAQLAPAESA